MVALLGTVMAFGKVPAVLRLVAGVTPSLSAVRRITQRAGAALLAVEAATVEQIGRECPASPPGPTRQQVSIDGAMVPIRGGEWREVKTMVIGALSATKPGKATALSYVSRLQNADQFAYSATGELHRRGTFAAATVVAVADGAVWCQKFYDYHLPGAVRILDFPHAVEHLHQAAQACFGPGSVQTRRWLATQAQTLRHGNPHTVIAAVAALPVAQSTDPADARAVRQQVRAYLQTRLSHLAYADFAAQGFPIGSGIVESANKLVVESRLKGPGMHWKEENVNPMLALRGAYCGQTWDQRWPELCRHQRQAARRSHPRSQPLPPPPPPTPAPGRPAPPLLAPRPRIKTIINGKPTQDHPWKRTYRARYGSVSHHANQTITKN
jgi:hypothetical protein